jgi:hypothetical protein
MKGSKNIMENNEKDQVQDTTKVEDKKENLDTKATEPY